jgi:Domain of unknown function (DUF4861)
MKTITIAVLLMFTCQWTINAQQKIDAKTTKSYAEISVKEGGKWVGQKYEGGTFKNVSSLKVPKSHWDHSFYIRYEGPGWESNKVGYRLYLDWRNAIDIFGKVTDTLVLPQVGQDGFESYHHMSPWGMDILKAGKALGIGSIGRYYGTEVLHFKEVDSTFAKVENGKKQATVFVKYKGWKTANDKIDFQSKLSIKPNERYTKHTIKSSKEIEGICTGMVKFKGIDLVEKVSENKKWAYIATYDKQTLVPDNLGMAIFYKVANVKEKKTSEFDHLLIFKPTKKEVIFYFLGAWEQEKDGIKTKEQFYQYLDEKLAELNKKNKI